MQIAFITGRTPDLSYQELLAAAEILPFPGSLTMVPGDIIILKPQTQAIGAENVEIGSHSHLQQNIVESLQQLQDRLGGTQKIAIMTGESDGSIDSILELLPGEKITFGISAYGRRFNVNSLGLNIKKKLQERGSKVRFVACQEGNALTTAQIIGNKLVKNGVEIILIAYEDQWLTGKTVAVQDIASYKKRDFEIPIPDAVSGMLPPKLAQIMVNLTGGATTIYDPFCGNGRIVEEARLMGVPAFGSDIEPKRVSASRTNLKWLAREFNIELERPVEEIVWEQDATESGKLPFTGKWYLVAEPYLGRPLRAPLQKSQQQAWLDELSELYLNFFGRWASSGQKPEGMIMVFPAAKLEGNNQWLSLYDTLVDRLNGLGYSSLQVSDYGRPDAVVKRQIVRVSFTN